MHLQPFKASPVFITDEYISKRNTVNTNQTYNQQQQTLNVHNFSQHANNTQKGPMAPQVNCTFSNYQYACVCVLQQHELDALGEVVPGVSCQELQRRRPARGDLEANAGRSHARRRYLGGSKTQEGVIYDKNGISF